MYGRIFIGAIVSIFAGVFCFGELDNYYKYTNYNPLADNAGFKQDDFMSPKGSARPQTWWHWIDGNISKAGIEKDLRAMASKGYGAAIIFHISDPVKGQVVFNSPEWFEMFEHAVKTAKKYGMEIGFHNCDGWSEAGGPWVDFDDSMKMLTFSRIRLKNDGSQKSITLAKPPNRCNFYKDIAVIAYPTKKPSDLPMLKNLVGIKPADNGSEVWGQNGWKSMVDGDVHSVFAIKSKDRNNITSYGAVLEFSEPFDAKGFALSVRSEWKRIADVFLEASDDGKKFKPIAKISFDMPDGVVGFRPHKAKFWKLAVYSKSLNPSQKYNPDWEIVVRDFELIATDSEPRNFSDLQGAQAKLGTITFLQSSYSQLEPTSFCTPINPKDVKIFKNGTNGDSVFDLKNLPKGEWEVMRLGYTTSNVYVHPATKGGFGKEVDKMSASALERHFNAYPKVMIERMQSIAPNVLRYVETDSWECGTQTWTEGFDEEFKKNHGYDMLMFAPLFAGEIVGNIDMSEKFASDLRSTMSHLINENFYGKFGELSKKAGILYETEPCGAFFMRNEFATYRAADIPQNEIWQNQRRIGNIGRAYGSTALSNVASVANFYGKKITTCESITAQKGNWADTPLILKPTIDSILHAGYNTVVFHSYVHQADESFPGWAMNPWGTTLNRKVTCWEMSKPFFDYIARCQYALQQGRAATEFLLFTGDEIPITNPNYEIPNNVEYAFIDGDGIRNFLRFENGVLTSPGKTSYKFLGLPNDKFISLETLKKIKSLVESGADVAGFKPQKISTLKGGEKALQEWKSLVEELFADGSKQIKNIGKGKLYVGYTPRELGEILDVKDNVKFYENSLLANDILWRKRFLPNGDTLYWFVNPQDRVRNLEIEIKESGTFVEMNPEEVFVKELISSVSNGKYSRILLSLNPNSSTVVVRKPHSKNIVNVQNVNLDGVKIFSAKQDSSNGRDDMANSNFSFAMTVSANSDRKLSEAKLDSIMSLDGQNFAVFPEGMHHLFGDKAAGAGLSVGKNSIGVYEHSANYLSCVLFYNAPIESGSRILVVYENNLPKLYINGKCVAVGQKSKRIVYAPNKLFGNFKGKLENNRFENFVLSDKEIEQDKHFKSRTTFKNHSSQINKNGFDLTYEFFDKGEIIAEVDGKKFRAKVENVPSKINFKKPFEVKFDKSWGAPEKAVFNAFDSWTKHSQEGVRNYSGTATYLLKFDVPTEALSDGVKAYFDAEKIAEVAEVFVNGKTAGILWKPPYRCDITSLLVSGENSLEVKVANTWVNRCLYDSTLPKEKRLTWANTMNVHFPPSDFNGNKSMAWNQGLIESGLLGDVEIIFSKTKKLKPSSK